MANSIKTRDGDTLSVGDFAGFKADMEETGRVTAIKGRDVHLSVFDPMTGKRDVVIQDAGRVWKE